MMKKIKRKNRPTEWTKDKVDLNIISLTGLIDIYRILHPTTAKYMLFSSSHGQFIKIKHVRGYKKHLNKFKRTQIV